VLLENAVPSSGVSWAEGFSSKIQDAQGHNSKKTLSKKIKG